MTRAQFIKHDRSGLRKTYKNTLKFELFAYLLYLTETRDFKGSWRLNRLIRSFETPNGWIVRNTPAGFEIIIEPSKDGYQKRIYELGLYEEGTINLMSKLLRRGDVFVDVGANIGLMTLHAARLVGQRGQVYSFEPHLEMFERLQQNIDLNEFKNICAVPMALGNKETSRKIFSFPSVNIGRSSLIYSSGAIDAGLAQVTTLDKFLSKRDIGTIRIIKIDVEGFELNVLEGGVDSIFTKFQPALCVEFSKSLPTEHKKESSLIYDYIMSFGIYRSYAFTRGKFQKSKISPIDNPDRIADFENIIFIAKEEENELPRDFIE